MRLGGSCGAKCIAGWGVGKGGVVAVEMHGSLPYNRVMATASSREAPETKRERMELRVTSSAKALIQRAAAVSGLSAGDLAYEGARRVLDSHEHMELTGADAEAFLKALDEPPEPTERLVEAVRRYRSMVG